MSYYPRWVEKEFFRSSAGKKFQKSRTKDPDGYFYYGFEKFTRNSVVYKYDRSRKMYRRMDEREF